MAIGWLAVLLSVPWSDVVKNAPLVADSAKKLWNAVARKSPRSLNTDPDAKATRSPEAQTIAALESRVSELETAAADLQNHMVASSELIKALADQNAQLVQGMEAMRIRVLWLAGAVLVAGMIAAASMIVVLMR